jgi:ABC-2 type transport system permease protein
MCSSSSSEVRHNDGIRRVSRKELTEIRRTWRLWVIPGMLVFFGVTSPIIAALTPALVKSVAASQPGVVMRVPTPRALDAYAQFLKNLDQFMLIAVIIAGAGVVSGERGSGTAILALTKPLSRVRSSWRRSCPSSRCSSWLPR